jgi:uncharacterized repeat protein (TIGR04076 family)
MFKSKATVIGFLGDEEKYPCHFQHKIGDEFVYDGERYIGRICSNVAPLVIPKMAELHAAGPRYVPAYYYYPFWYAPCSVKDPNLKKYDGLGFRNVLQTQSEPPGHAANMMPSTAWKWPPHPERTVARDPGIVVCPDTRTLLVMKVKAFDLSDKGYDVPFFRREMAILSKVSNKQSIQVDKILNEFSGNEIEGIYPALSQILLETLIEELGIMGYLEIINGKASVTEKGQKKIEDFRESLSPEEREALNM